MAEVFNIFLKPAKGPWTTEIIKCAAVEVEECEVRSGEVAGRPERCTVGHG